jgi:ribose-phosphate pyrophosphokinase
MAELDDLRLITGRSNPELANLISEKLGIPLTKVIYKDFGNSEIYAQIEQSIRKCNVYIIQTGGAYEGRSINDHIMELYQLIDICKRSNAKSTTIILPTYPYARSDKRVQSRTAIMASCIAQQLTSLGISRIVSMDMHNAAIQGFTNISFDNLYAIKPLIAHMKNTLFKGMTQEEINENYVLSAADTGALRAIEKFAKILKMNYVTMNKHRDYSQISVVLNSELIGDKEMVKNKTCIVIDDICDTMGTSVSASNELETYGVRDIIIVATHGVFSEPAMKRINECKMISQVIVTNTLPQKYNLEQTKKLVVVDLSTLFSETIRRIHLGESVSQLFD